MQIVMGWPEYIIVGLIAFEIIANTVKTTKGKDTASKVGMLIGTIANPIVWLWLLYQGGFFN